MLARRALVRGWPAALIERHQAVLACVIASLILLALHRSFGVTALPYDSAHYWDLASLNTLANSASWRGYVFPALLTPLRKLTELRSNPVLTYRIGISVVYGVLLTTLLPVAYQLAFGGKVTLLRRLVPVLLSATLFPGLLLYPLSDLPAALLAFAALMCALKGLQRTSSARRFFWMLVASGALMGAAYNTRVIYLFAGVPLGLLALLTFRGPGLRAPYPRWLGLAAFAVGVLAVSLPQLAINIRTHGVMSAAVQSQVNQKSLFASQLVWGMTVQRYETTVAEGAPAPQVYYLDPAGIQLFDVVSRAGDLFSFGYYLKVVATHPLQFVALYTRHFINGLDVRDGPVYTRKASSARNRTALLNFLILALAAWVAVCIRQRDAHRHDDAFKPAAPSWPAALAVLLIPVVAIVPGAIETRFFLPLHLMAYCTIAMHFDGPQLLRNFRRHWVVIPLALALAAGAFFDVSLDTMANVNRVWPDIYRLGP
jgi:hypothetical protein